MNDPPLPLSWGKGHTPSYPHPQPALGTHPPFHFTPSDGGLDIQIFCFLCKGGVPLLLWGVGVPLIDLKELPPLLRVKGGDPTYPTRVGRMHHWLFDNVKNEGISTFSNVTYVTFDVSTSEFNVKRYDSDKIRQKNLTISYTEWQKMGFSKGTLYYVKKNAAGDQPFTLNKHVMTP